MTGAAASSRRDDAAASAAAATSNYELFIGVLTIFSLIVTVFLVLVDVGPVYDILFGTDTLLCFVFLFDFVLLLHRAPVKRVYLWPHGVVDLVASIPGAGPLRVLRVFRLRQIVSRLGARGQRRIVRDFLSRRAEAALYLIVVLSLLVVTIGSCLVVIVEQSAPGSNIRTGGDAFWWAFVTIATVGYGDRFPVTATGRLVAMLTMAVGIGIFGVLTSYLSTALLAPKRSDAASDGAPPETAGAAPASVAAPASLPESAATAAGDRTALVDAPPFAGAGADRLADEIAALRREIADLRSAIGPR